jgi:L-lactate dehydrogenase complex protein LldG
MSTSRDKILGKLRAARRPFDDAPPRPAQFIPVTIQDDESPDALLERFSREMKALRGDVFPVEGDDAAIQQVLDRLAAHEAKRILAWDFACIPLIGLEAAIRAAGIEIVQPDAHADNRTDVLALSETAQASLTGADAVAATTATLVFSTAPGRGRIPTVLAPVHIAVITLDQIVTRVESWIARQRETGLEVFRASANVCFVSGPSRTGDIEMQLILGVHGPGKLEVIVKR